MLIESILRHPGYKKHTGSNANTVFLSRKRAVSTPYSEIRFGGVNIMEYMEKINEIAFVGGDLRQIRAINQMSKSGIPVRVFGFGGESAGRFHGSVTLSAGLDGLNDEYRAIVLPLPYTTDGENINAPFLDKAIAVADIVKAASGKNRLLAGKCDEKLETMAKIYDVPLTDYFCREELMIRNAVPTAEGAIQIAMEETPHTLHGSECLITGYGRIGKILAEMLRGIGANVTVAARKQRDLASALSFGCSTVPLWELYGCINEFDIIFNTVPSLLFDFNLLSKLHKHCLMIDLASKPGGVDFEAARALGIKAIWALSLPGKVAPDTAGDIIKDTVLNILSETEV